MAKMKKKKILIVDLGGVMGGVEYYVETLSGMLRERATLVSLCVLPELAQHLRSLGVKVFLIPAFPRLRALRFLLAFGLLPIIILRETGADRPGQWFFRIGTLDTRAPAGARGSLHSARTV
jgi:hypothetical protein